MEPARAVNNFSAGPALLPLEVLQIAQSEMIDWHGSGMSVMEMSHRGKEYESIIGAAAADLASLLKLPKNYKVLFLQGGATGMFAGVPLNLTKGFDTVDYLVTGHWGKGAVKEAQKYVKNVNIVASGESTKFTQIPDPATWKFSPNAAYFHFTSNETIHGVEFGATCPNVPEGTVVVCDMSSDFLSRPIPDIEKYGVIYAGAQKNAGPAGVVIAIVREDLLERALPICPGVWVWKDQAKNQSMLNTPPCYPIYICGLYFKWLLKMGGLEAIAARNAEKASRLYRVIDNSAGYYISPVHPSCRSAMNVPFRIMNNDALEDMFLKEASKAKLLQLKGHRSVGGLRASIYNACALGQVEALVAFMEQFQKAHPTPPAPAQ